jgi:ubiquinol-cytochrome c reductase cytochrome c1 subunit
MRRLTSYAGLPAFRASLIGIAGLVALAFVGNSTALAQESGHEEGEGEAVHYPLRLPPLESWSFAGFFGKYDQIQLQRGFQVYREVCSVCHGLELVAFRNLGDEGGPHFSEAEVRALAAEYQITDGPDSNGDMFERQGRPSDYLPNPFPNPQAAAAANGGAPPPDLSVMAKARGVGRGIQWTLLDFFTQYQEGGPDYIHALLTGYQDPPPGVEVPPGGYYNPYFVSGAVLAMPLPLSEGIVTYADGSPETVDQYSRDVSAFLMWAAEPHLVERKRIGYQVFIFLIVFAGLMYFTKKKVWAAVPH